MQIHPIYSDQLHNWSAYERLDHCATPPTSSFGKKASPARAPYSSRFPHRALQTVRQSRLQMPAWPGARAQVLLVGKPSRWPTRDGLRPSRVSPTGLRLLAELPESPTGAGADLQPQPRNLKASRQVLTLRAHATFTLISDGYRLGWDPCRQLFAKLVASRLCPAHRPSNQSYLP